MNFQKLKSYKLNRGMTYVEVAVVLFIFAAMSSVVMFSHRDFQAKVDVENLAGDIAYRVIGAQKSAISGLWAPLATTGWKPSYGLFFNAATPKSFIYFADLNNDTYFDGLGCPGTTECLEEITITTNESITKLEAVDSDTTLRYDLDDLIVTFTRPDSGADLRSSTPIFPEADYLAVTISSPRGKPDALIKIFPSGRIEVK